MSRANLLHCDTGDSENIRENFIFANSVKYILATLKIRD